MRQIHDSRRRHAPRPAAAVLLTAALIAAPAPLTAQSWSGLSTRLPPGTTLEGYVARAVLDPAVVGTRARVAGAGARLLLPLQSLTRSAPDALARRTSVGAFVTAAPASEGEGEVEARHYGLQADVRLTDAAVADRVEPLASLGVGMLRSRRLSDGPEVGRVCLVVTDVPNAARTPACVHRRTGEAAGGGSYPAVSPAVGVRVALLPGLALRADVRDAIVFRGGARHNLELGTGLSFVW